MAALDDFPHLAEQEGQQQSTDVRTVHIGIGHDDDGVITEFVRVEFFPADATTQRGDQGADLGRGQHLVKAGFLDVQDLTFQGQDGLGLTITALLGTTTRRITLHNEQFGEGRVFFLAVRQLAGQAGNVQGALTAGHIPCLTGCFPGTGRFDHLVNDLLGFVGLLLQVLRKALIQFLLHRRLHFRGHQLVLGLGGELGIGHFHTDDSGQAFPGIITGGRYLGFLAQAFMINVVVQRAGQCCPETGQVSTTIPLGNIVGEAVDVFLEGIVPLHGHFYRNAIFPLTVEMEDTVDGRLVGIQVLNKGPQTTFIFKNLLLA